MARSQHTIDGLDDELAPGVVFVERYVIERELGRGARGVVYQAFDRSIGERIALKVLISDSGREESFLREARLARRITHPNVIRVHDVGRSSSGQPFITMELVQGRDLASLVEKRAIAPELAASLAAELCGALAAAHDLGIIHRDLKPANVLIEGAGDKLPTTRSELGRVLLADFGCAFLPEQMTASAGFLIGTPLYVSPEQLTPETAIDARSDLYSLGVMLYQLVVGEPPFTGTEPLMVAHARLLGDAPDPRAKASLPAGLAALILRCLARDPACRPSSARELARALAPFANERLAYAETEMAVSSALPTPRQEAPGESLTPAATSESSPTVTSGPFEHAFAFERSPGSPLRDSELARVVGAGAIGGMGITRFHPPPHLAQPTPRRASTARRAPTAAVAAVPRRVALPSSGSARKLRDVIPIAPCLALIASLALVAFALRPGDGGGHETVPRAAATAPAPALLPVSTGVVLAPAAPTAAASSAPTTNKPIAPAATSSPQVASALRVRPLTRRAAAR